MKQFIFCVSDEKNFYNGIRDLDEYCSCNKVSSLLFHLYCGINDEEMIMKCVDMLKTKFPDALLTGISSNGEIMDGRLIDKDILVSAIVFESSLVSVHEFNDAADNVYDIGKQIRYLADSTENIVGVELLFPGSQMDSMLLLGEVSKCRRDISVFGGYPMGHDMDGDEVFVVSSNGIDSNTVLAVLYSGEQLHIDADKTAGWEKLGQSFTITKAKGHLLSEIGGKPAYEVYEKYLKITQEGDFTRDTVEFPLLISTGDEEILRHAYSYSEDGSIYLSGNVNEGDKVYLTYGNPGGIFDKVNERCNVIRGFEPDVILLYSCAARKVFWYDEMANKETEPFAKLGSTVGFFTGGELIRTGSDGAVFEHNITMLSIAMREGDKKGRELPEVRVDDTMIVGQAYLLKRLAHLVQSTNAEIELMNEQLQNANEQLRYMAITDELTRLYNRREIERRIGVALEKTVNTDDNVGLIMIDVDHFKKVNDELGHDVGDYVLQEVAGILKSAAAGLEGADAGRWGGEEFFIVIPGSNMDKAKDVAEKVRRTIEDHHFEGLDRLTASFGVAVGNYQSDKKELYVKVDDALYVAKNSGRNCVAAAEC